MAQASWQDQGIQIPGHREADGRKREALNLLNQQDMG